MHVPYRPAALQAAPPGPGLLLSVTLAFVLLEPSVLVHRRLEEAGSMGYSLWGVFMGQTRELPTSFLLTFHEEELSPMTILGHLSAGKCDRAV